MKIDLVEVRSVEGGLRFVAIDEECRGRFLGLDIMRCDPDDEKEAKRKYLNNRAEAYLPEVNAFLIGPGMTVESNGKSALRDYVIAFFKVPSTIYEYVRNFGGRKEKELALRFF